MIDETTPPTERQVEILRAITWFIDTRGYPPTVRDLRDKFGHASTHGYAQHLTALVRKGLIERQPRIARSIRITARGAAVSS